jgi:hypothetical protein
MQIGNFGFSMVRRCSPQVLDFGLWERKPMPEKPWLQVLNSCSGNRKSKIQNRKWLGLSVIAFVLVAAGAVAQAQQPKKVPLQYLDILAPKDIGTAFEAATKGRAEAVLALSSFIIISSERRLQNSPQRTVSRRSTHGLNLLKTAGS